MPDDAQRPPTPSNRPKIRPAVAVPAVGIVLALIVGAASSGLSGALISAGFVVLIGAAWHLITGRRFLGAPGKKVGVGLLVIALLGMGVGGAFAEPSDGAADPAAHATTSAPSATAHTPSAAPTTQAAPSPTPTPTLEDLANPDDPALNAGAAADLAAPAPAGSSDTSKVLGGATGQTALVALAQLAVHDNPSMAGYVRDLFGYRAFDTDRNGCDTRNDILRRDLTNTVIKDGTNNCVVLSGILADPYSATSIAFTRGTATSNDVQIDHVVALGDAWESGASTWSADTLHQYGNDPLNLLAVSGPLNSQKGDSAANEWLPPNAAFRCTYVARQVGVKLTYSLSVTTAERNAMAAVLSSCPGQALPDGSKLPTPVTKATPTKAAAAPTQAAPVVQPPAAPTQAPPPAAPSYVTAGAYCSPAGATGVTKNGVAVVCGTYDKSPDRARWHQP